MKVKVKTLKKSLIILTVLTVITVISVIIITSEPEQPSIDEIMNDDNVTPDQTDGVTVSTGEVLGSIGSTKYILKQVATNQITVTKQHNDYEESLTYSISIGKTISLDNGVAQIIILDYGTDWVKVALI